MKTINRAVYASSACISNVLIYAVLGLVTILIIGFSISPLIAISIIYVLTVGFAIKNDKNTFIYFLIFVFLQNLVMVLLANKFTGSETTLFMISKELMLYGCFAIHFMRKQTIDKLEVCFIVYLLVLAVSFFMSDAAMYSRVVAARQLCLPLMCIFFGYHLTVGERDMKKIEGFILKFCLAVGIIGLIEVFILGDDFWQILPLEQFNINKGTDFNRYNGVPVNFYTWDYVSIVGKPLRRMASFFADPLMTGGMLFTGIVIADNFRKNSKIKGKYILAELFLIACGFLTLSKGYYVAILVFFGMKIFVNFGYKRMKKAMQTVIAMLLCAIIGGKILLKVLPHSSTTIHLSGLYNGISNGTLLGNGLGKAGIIANKLTGLEENLAAESFIGVLLAQIGYVGLAVFIFIMGSFIWSGIKNYCKYKDIRLYNYSVMIIAVLCQSLFSESSIGIVVTGTSFILLGLVVREAKERAKNEET